MYFGCVELMVDEDCFVGYWWVCVFLVVVVGWLVDFVDYDVFGWVYVLDVVVGVKCCV